MFQDDVLSITPVPSEFIWGGDNPKISTLWYSGVGPIQVSDTSDGLTNHVWVCYLLNNWVWLQKEGGQPSPIIPAPDSTITKLSMAFDQNANIVIAYVQAGLPYYYSLESFSYSYIHTALPEGNHSLLVALDDLRAVHSTTSDIILAYININGALCFRKQRDRFTIEYILDAGPYISLERMRMNAGLRFQWEVVYDGTTLPPVKGVPVKFARCNLDLIGDSTSSQYIKDVLGEATSTKFSINGKSTELEVLRVTTDNIYIRFSNDPVSNLRDKQIDLYIGGETLALERKSTREFEAKSTPELAATVHSSATWTSIALRFTGSTTVETIL